MNICTALTADWVDSHGVRWVRYINEYAPEAKKHLFFLSDTDIHQQFPGFADNFECVVTIPFEDRAQFNRVRMSATTHFGVGDILWCDADADILDDLSAIPALVADKTLACVESPANHRDWNKMCADNGWDVTEYNNGLLYMADDWGERYDEAVKAVAEFEPNPRISGTIAFNWMLKQTDDWVALPYDYGVIWWDSTNFPTAKIVQYCNDNGQRKRVMMEEEYRASIVPEVAE